MVTLSLEEDLGAVSHPLWLLSLARNLEDYEFFYALNVLTDFQYCRKDDLVLEKEGKKYYHSVYEGFSQTQQISVQFLGNEAFYEEGKPVTKAKKAKAKDAERPPYVPHRFIPDYPEVQFIVRIKEGGDDFSLLLLPEKLIFSPKQVMVEEDSALYQTIAYYE